MWRLRGFAKTRLLGYLLAALGAAAVLAPLATHLYYAREKAAMLTRTDEIAPDVETGTAAAPPDAERAPAAEGGPSRPPGPDQEEPAPLQTGLPVRMEIPAIGLKQAVKEGWTDAVLDRGPGIYPGAPAPGEAGNIVMAGHRTQRGIPSFFYHLNRLSAGDEILLVYPDRTVRYTVERVFVVPPTEVSVMRHTSYPALTLITCDPPGTVDQRLIVRASMVF